MRIDILDNYNKTINIGKFQIGHRKSCNDAFHFFYCPLLKCNRKEFVFFWWFGKKWYAVLHK